MYSILRAHGRGNYLLQRDGFGASLELAVKCFGWDSSQIHGMRGCRLFWC